MGALPLNSGLRKVNGIRIVKIGIAEIQKLIDKGDWVRKKIGADFTRVWFFSHDGFTQEAEKFMEQQGVLWSTRADLDGLLDYMKLRRLPEL
jgi:hypothetical protein